MLWPPRTLSPSRHTRNFFSVVSSRGGRRNVGDDFFVNLSAVNYSASQFFVLFGNFFPTGFVWIFPGVRLASWQCEILKLSATNFAQNWGKVDFEAISGAIFGFLDKLLEIQGKATLGREFSSNSGRLSVVLREFWMNLSELERISRNFEQMCGIPSKLRVIFSDFKQMSVDFGGFWAVFSEF